MKSKARLGFIFHTRKNTRERIKYKNIRAIAELEIVNRDVVC